MVDFAGLAPVAVLAQMYRISLSAFRCATGDTIEGGFGSASNPLAATFGINMGGVHASEILQSPNNNTDDIVASAVSTFILPANYVAGSNFTITIGVLDDSGLSGDELAGKQVGIVVQTVPLDSYNNLAATLISSTQDVTDGNYVAYQASTDPVAHPAVTTLQPGDMISIKVTTTWPKVTEASLAVVVNASISLAA